MITSDILRAASLRYYLLRATVLRFAMSRDFTQLSRYFSIMTPTSYGLCAGIFFYNSFKTCARFPRGASAFVFFVHLCNSFEGWCREPMLCHRTYLHYLILPSHNNLERLRSRLLREVFTLGQGCQMPEMIYDKCLSNF